VPHDPARLTPLVDRGLARRGNPGYPHAFGFSYLRSGIAPARILRFVASGALGPDALKGGAGAAAAGLGFHYLIALIVTIVFFTAAAVVPKLLERPFLTGPLYGIVVYVVMNYAVVPLSRIGPWPTPATIVWTTGVLVHMLFIGMPIALAARRAFGSR
jgi:hypothetical protein